MGKFKILNEDYKLGRHEYLIDSSEDLKYLPADDVGSAALVAATGDIYILNNKKQ